MTNWTKVTDQYNVLRKEPDYISVRVYSPSNDKALEVVVPADRIENFMNHLPLFEAEVTNGPNSEIAKTANQRVAEGDI